MYKLKLRKILIFAILCINTIGKAQDFARDIIDDSARAILYRVEVAELTDKPKTILGGYDTGRIFVYTGEILSGVARLTNTKFARLKLVGKVPDKKIAYWGERFNVVPGRKVVIPKNTEPVTVENMAAVINKISHQENQNDPANVMILNVLKMTYGFSVKDVEDSCEVWVAKIANENRLSTYATIYGNNGAGPIKRNGREYYELNSFKLEALWDTIERVSKRIVYDETVDNRKFSLEMPIDNLNDIDAANAALAPFGLYLVKEKRLEKIKLIQFND